MTAVHDIRDSFDRHAARYDRHAALEQEVCSRLLERVTFRRGEPSVVLDLGCGTGVGASALKKSFRKSLVVGLDLSTGMLEIAGKQSGLMRPVRFVNGDMAELPFGRHTTDLVFSSLALPWLGDPVPFFEEVLRVLRPGGMFLFSTYGTESLAELGEALAGMAGRQGGPLFPDLLQLGDALTTAGFREPVMDVDRVSLHYPGIGALATELETTGTSLLVDGWEAVASGSDGLERAWPGQEAGGKFPLGFEILYGMAFGPPEGQPRRTEDGEIATFSVDSLLKSRNLGYD